MCISYWSSDVGSSDLDLRGGGRRWMTNSVGFLIVRRICLRSFLRGPMRDGQVPGVPDRHEAKAEAQNPAGQRGNAIGETEQIADDDNGCADQGCDGVEIEIGRASCRERVCKYV